MADMKPHPPANAAVESSSKGSDLSQDENGTQPRGPSMEQPCHNFKQNDHDLERVPNHTAKLVKKRPATPITTPALNKKMRTAAVQRTHSPRGPVSSPCISPVRSPKLQKVTPTLKGIKDVCRHLLTRNTGEKAHLVAIPTECTYEVCSAISWSKRESMTEEESIFRNRQLDQLIQASSRSSVHVYMTHQNIRHLDKLLFFPKKTYAIRQNPSNVARFNETRIIFQRLADLFWPGAVILYLQPESFVPQALIHFTTTEITTNKNSSNPSHKSGSDSRQQYVGFRCPSHPLPVKILKQIQQECSDPVVLVGSVAQQDGSSILKAKEVAHNFASNLSQLSSRIQVLNGEERREIFAVPTCEFQDAWLECWIDSKTRTVTLKNKSKAAVGRNIKGNHMLRDANTKNQVIRSILHYWKVVDLTQE